MKIGEAQKLYREQRQILTEQRKALISQREQIKKMRADGLINKDDQKLLIEEAATLELSIKDINKKFDQNQKVLDRLSEMYSLAWNMEVARQQADAAEDYGEELAKIMEIARRIASGASVPAKDEKKLMEFSKDMYMAAKQAAMLHEDKKKKKYDSLWDDEEEPQEEYDPEGKAESIEVSVPKIDVEV